MRALRMVLGGGGQVYTIREPGVPNGTSGLVGTRRASQWVWYECS